VFIVVSVYFLINPIQKLLDTPSYIDGNVRMQDKDKWFIRESLVTFLLLGCLVMSFLQCFINCWPYGRMNWEGCERKQL